MNRIPDGSLYLTRVSRYPACGPVTSASPAGGSFDQLQLSHQLGEEEKRAWDLTAKVSRQVRMEHTAGRIDQLRSQIEAGVYQIDADQIAARMLLEIE